MATIRVERVQTGVRLEKRLMKVLKATAEMLDIPLGELIEGICLHSFAGRSPFDAELREKIESLKQVYGLDLGPEASHHMSEREDDECGDPADAA